MWIKRLFWKGTFLFFKLVLRNATLRIDGVEHIPKGPFILVSNHDHPWDPTILWVVMHNNLKKNTHFFTGRFLFKGLRRCFLHCLEQIPVQSGSTELNTDAFKKSQEYLKNGGIIGIFPYPYDIIKKRHVLYTGVIKLLQQNDVSYVPIKIKIKEKWKWKSYYDKNFDYVKICIGMPQKNILYRKMLNRKDSIKFAENIINKIASLQVKC